MTFTVNGSPLTERYLAKSLFKTDGNLYAWGNNSYAQLGIENLTLDRKLSPIQVGALSNWASVSSNLSSSGEGQFTSTFIIKTDGTLWGCGYNAYGQLGLFDTIRRSSFVQVGTQSNWSQVFFGYIHAAIIKTDGTLWTCGYNYAGQLGLSDTVNRSSPVQVGTQSNWAQIACGYDFSTAIKTDGTLWTCGYGDNGQLGNNTTTGPLGQTLIFYQVGTLNNWSKVSNNGRGSLSIKTDSTLWSWGQNNFGQLGLSDTDNRSSPVQIGTLSNWSVNISSAWFYNAAIKTDGTLWAWGNNSFGQLGLSNRTHRSSPVQVGTASNWSKVSCGGTHMAALKTDGTLWTCGYNRWGQLGLSNITNRSILIQVGTLNQWSQIGAGSSSTFAIDIV
jgi:alpha-tubulin suppressor-like RCC1 family protein